ncbi:hypothetical protein PV02_10580 [Methanolobus chelungpuianus]|uniref:Methanogenesis regulatory protein FilR1 middle domain-containing protein n=2 Tax=Methanolobus chelungpuianus TaxID=502115 RepID=A0AAE3KY87_9EURY|nr:hypothetical protein [Methanolobus chelungpuianus]
MKKSLLDLLFKSERRKNILLLLQDSPMDMEALLRSINSPRQSLLPQLRLLETHYLIAQSDDAYELTSVGRLLMERMKPLLGIVDTLDCDINYWGKHKLDFIPPHLLSRMRDLGICKVITPCLVNLYDINEEFFEKCKTSKSLTIAVTFLYPNFPEIYNAWIDRGVQVTVIVSKGLFEIIRSNYADEFRKLLSGGKLHLLVYNDVMDFVSFGHNDHCAFFRLFLNTGEYDNNQLMCCSPGAVEWARELCEHYRKNSTPVNDV